MTNRHFLSFTWYSTKCSRCQSNLQKGYATQSTVITALSKQPQVLPDLMTKK